MMTEPISLSREGQEFLSDSVIYATLSVIASSVGVTPEEYLSRFEEKLSESPEAIFSIFEKPSKSGEIV